MKICFFTSGVYPVGPDTVKAIEFWTYKVAKELKRRGHEIHIFGENTSSKDFILHPPRTGKTPYDNLKNRSYYGCYVADNFCQCLNYVKKHNIDIIHDQTTIAYVLRLAEFSEVPVVTTFHVVRNSPDLADFYKDCNFTYNISPSKYLAQTSADIDFYEVIPHGVDIDQFVFNEKEGSNFIFAGKIIESKGPIYAIEAANEAGLGLTVAGYEMDGMDNKRYFDQTMKLINSSKNVNYIGKVPRSKICNYMADAKALLMPFIEGEAFGLVMIEAMSCGTPIITFDIGTAREIVKDGITGYVVPVGDSHAMAEAMKKIGNIDRKKCRQYAEDNFSFDKMVSKYEAIYNKVIGEFKDGK